MRTLQLLSMMLVVVWTASCQTKPQETPAEKGAKPMGLTITSSTFQDGATIPQPYTCDGQDKSPPLTWNGVPALTKSFALICDDPDAPMGTWNHWTLWNIPPDSMKLEENFPKTASHPSGIRQGLNSWPKVGYGGPCPPPGKPHRYIFQLYALDAMLDLPEKSNRSALEKALKGHILAEARLTGKFGR
jgi:Raf kinase inhibitor-like YbhB/YbcL family protein